MKVIEIKAEQRFSIVNVFLIHLYELCFTCYEQVHAEKFNNLMLTNQENIDISD